MRRILIGYDGSEAAGRALDHACELARFYKCPLTVLAAEADRLFDKEGGIVPMLDRDLGRSIAAQGALRAREQGVPDVEGKTSLEAADDALVLTAGEGYDLVVIGHRSQGALQEMILGSTAKSVLNRVGCPVLVVR